MTELRDDLQAALGTTYRIEQELGGGGMSRVFLAEEVGLGPEGGDQGPAARDGAPASTPERFRREIQLAARLQHPHIVPLLDRRRAPATCSTTSMPFIEGESLRARLAREGELPVTEAVRILRDVADALAYAHEQGVVHRDIKPDNVLLSGRHALVTDFGVAKAVSDSGRRPVADLARHGARHAGLHGARSRPRPTRTWTTGPTSTRSGAMAYEMLCGPAALHRRQRRRRSSRPT